MTNQHPLTDKICLDIAAELQFLDDMRAAADWQLEQVVKWLRNNLNEAYADHLTEIENGEVLAYILTDDVVNDLIETMRPQQLENN